jgi:transposase-like protein
MAVIPDFKRTTLTDFLKENVAPGSTVYTDGLKSFAGLQEAGFEHVPHSQPRPIELAKERNPWCLWRTVRLETCSNG